MRNLRCTDIHRGLPYTLQTPIFALPIDGRVEEGYVKAGAAVPTAFEEHIPENLGDGPVEMILIELKPDQ